MYLKKLKSQNKFIVKISSIFITVCTVLYLTVPSSYYKAETVSYDGNGYSIVQGFTETVVTSGNTNTSQNVIKTHNTITITFEKIVSGQILLNISFCTVPRNTLVGVIGGNVYLYSIGTNNLSFYVQFNGVNRVVVELENINTYVGNFNTNYPNWAKVYPTLNSHTMSNLVEMTASEVQTMLNIKNSIYNIETYVDGLETVLTSIDTSNSQISNHLQTVHNDLVDLTNDIGDLATKLNTLHSDNSTIISRLGTNNSTLTTISSRLNQVKNNTDTIISKMNTNTSDVQLINDIDTNMNIVNNIEGGFLNDLNLDIISGKNGYEYIRDVLVNHNIHTSAIDTLNVYQNELIGSWGAGQHIFSYLHNYLTLIIAFILIGVIIG